MSPVPRAAAHPHRAGAAGLVLGSIVSVQVGAAFAARLMSHTGVLGSVALRVGIAALVLLLALRPGVRSLGRGDWAAVAGLGCSLAVMNATFYGALARLPLGVAVTVEFLGPLALAAWTSRRARDLGACLVAVAGVILISRAATEPLSQLDLLGLGLAALAGACWAWYILASGAVGRRVPGLDGVAIAMGLAALLVVPLGIVEGGARLLTPATLVLGAGVALLSSAIPYSLELLALRRLPSSVFGVLMALEPAVAALAGLAVLGQRLAWPQLAGMALVVAASALVLAVAPEPAHPRRDGS